MSDRRDGRLATLRTPSASPSASRAAASFGYSIGDSTWNSARLARHGWTLPLTAYGDGHRRATFYVTRDRAFHRGRLGLGDDPVASGPAGGVGGGDVELVPGQGAYADFFIAACWRICLSQHPAW